MRLLGASPSDEYRAKSFREAMGGPLHRRAGADSPVRRLWPPSVPAHSRLGRLHLPLLPESMALLDQPSPPHWRRVCPAKECGPCPSPRSLCRHSSIPRRFCLGLRLSSEPLVGIVAPPHLPQGEAPPDSESIGPGVTRPDHRLGRAGNERISRGAAGRRGSVVRSQKWRPLLDEQPRARAIA
jgi:hypothetical protein